MSYPTLWKKAISCGMKAIRRSVKEIIAGGQSNHNC
jgi:hypothetical protein